jgi:hypothetical protein
MGSALLIRVYKRPISGGLGHPLSAEPRESVGRPAPGRPPGATVRGRPGRHDLRNDFELLPPD